MLKLNIKKIATLSGHTGSIYCLNQDLSNDSKFLSSGGDGSVVQWDMEDLSKAQLFARVKSQLFSMNITSACQYLLLGEMKGGIHVLDLDEKEEVRYITYHENGVFAISNSEKNTIISTGGDGKISCWSVPQLDLINDLKLSDKSIRCMDIHSNGIIAAFGSSDNIIYIVDLSKFEIIHRLSKHENSVFSVKFSPDGKYLLSGSRDAQLAIWNVEKKYDLYRVIPAHLFTINSIAYHPMGRMFATASRDKTVKIWDADNFNLLKVIDQFKLEGHKNSVNALLWHRKTEYLISASDDRMIMIWQIK